MLDIRKKPTILVGFIFLVILILVLLIVGLSYRTRDDKISIALVSNVTVIDIYTGTKQLMDILIHDDRIVRTSSPGTLAIAKDSKVIDATGQYAVPGFWDMHVHLTFVPELEDRISSLFIANGITSVRDMGGKLDEILAFRKKTNQPDLIAPKIWLAGPLVDGAPPLFDGQHLSPAISTAVDTPKAGALLVDKLAASGVDLIKIYEMLSPDVFNAVVKRAQHHGLPVAGHVPLRVTLQQAIGAGMKGIEHLSGIDFACAQNSEALLAEGITVLNSRKENEGAVVVASQIHTTLSPKAMASEDSDQCSALMQTFVDQNVWHTPTVARASIQVFKLYDQPGILEPLRYLPALLDNKRYVRVLKKSAKLSAEHKKKDIWRLQKVKDMNNVGVKFLAGTDAPVLLVPGFSLHDELKGLVLAGLSPLAALQSATLHPAEFFAIDDELGSIEVGKIADIILLNADPLEDINNTRSIQTVIARGRILDRKMLDTLLEDMDQ